MTSKRMLAGALLGTWTAWWTFFAFVQTPPLPIAAGAALAFLLIPLAAWRWRGPGGAALVGEALVLLAWTTLHLHNRPETTLFLVLTLVLPPLGAGILLLTDDGKRRAPIARGQGRSTPGLS